MTEENKLTAGDKSEFIKELDLMLDDNDFDPFDDFIKEVRDELFVKINYVESQKTMISDQIKEINVLTEKAIKYREIIEKARDNANELYYAVQSTGSVFNELHDKLSKLAKNSDVLQTGDLLKILNDYDKYSVDESVFTEDTPVQIETDYN